MTTPKPTPEQKPVSPDSEETRQDSADENTSPRAGFFNRIQRELKPEPIHPSEAEEIVIMEGDGK